MLSVSKPTASLSSGLLARKGQARPAMRSQGFHGSVVNPDDLGWDDMGDDLAPAPPKAPLPAVLIERETLREEIEEAAAAPAPVSTADVARIGREMCAATAKAAFTLRLDPDRHLRLRLASASRNRSAQALVVDALDAFIASLPEIEGLVSQLTSDRTVTS